MPIEVSRESVQHVVGLSKNISIHEDIKMQTAKTAELRQKLPSKSQSEPIHDDIQTNDVSEEVIERQVESINSKVQNLQRDLQFSVDADSGRTIIKVIDSETQQTIRTIPPEDITVIEQRLESHTGVLFNSNV